MNLISLHFQTLGLEPNASPAEIRASYRRLAKTWHPDTYSDPALKKQAEAEIKKINEAYGSLKNYQPSSEPNSLAPESHIRTTATSADAFYQQGVDHIKQGNYPEAIEEFTKAIRINPGFAQAYEQRGHACSLLGFEHRATSDFKKALDLQNPFSTASVTEPEAPVPKPTAQGQRHPKPKAPKPDGRATESTPLLWKLSHRFSAHEKAVTAIALSPNGRVLATGSADHTLKLWDVATAEQLMTLKLHSDTITCLAFSPDGSLLAAGSKDISIKLWSLETQQVLSNRLGHSAAVNDLTFSPDGELLVSAGDDKIIKIWHLGMGSLLHLLRGQGGGVTDVAVSEDNQTCFAKDSAGNIMRWQIKTGKALPLSIHYPKVPIISAFAMNAKGQIVAIGASSEILVYSIDEDKKVWSLKRHLDTVNYLKFIANGEILISAGRDQKVMLWRLSTGEWMETLDLYNGKNSLKTVEANLDGDLIIGGWQDGMIQIWQRGDRPF